MADRPSSTRFSAAAGDRVLLFLLAAAIIGAFLQITLGGVVRVTESGLGCPDWPLCHGRIIPEFEYHTLLEWSHRTVGSFVGLIFVAAVARVWISHRSNRPLVISITAGLFLISLVGGIGGAVVLSELDPALRTLHLGLAEIVVLLALIAFGLSYTGWLPGMTLRAGQAVASVGTLMNVRRVANVAAAIALVALLSGSYAVWRGAGAVCPEWPFCGGPIIPDNELTWIHMIHRILAGVSVVVALWAAHRAYRLKGVSSPIRLVALGVLAAMVLQVFVGALNPWTDFSQWAQAIHLSLATLVWTTLSLMAILLALQPFGRESVVHEPQTGQRRVATGGANASPNAS